MSRKQFTAPEAFREFGGSALPIEKPRCREQLVLPADDALARRAIRASIPALPGVYGWIGSAGHLIYVGKSKSLRHRLISYFAKQPADPKMARIRHQGCRLVWETVADELLALLREQELICRFRPDWNSQGQPHRRQPAFVAMSRSAAPHAFVARQLRPECQAAFGPIAGMSDLRESVTALNHFFGLRDCSDRTRFEYGDQPRLFADEARALCLRYELKTCPGPCAGLCRQVTYQEGLDRAMNFLRGRDRSCLKIMEHRMINAAAQHQYERAAMLRDRWQSLVRLDRQLGRLRQAKQAINGARVIRIDHGREWWLIFRHGRLVDGAWAPRSPAQQRQAAEELARWAALPENPPGSILEINWQLIIAAWFRKYPQELRNLISLDDLRATCQSNSRSPHRARSLRNAS